MNDFYKNGLDANVARQDSDLYARFTDLFTNTSVVDATTLEYIPSDGVDDSVIELTWRKNDDMLSISATDAVFNGFMFLYNKEGMAALKTHLRNIESD